MQNSLTASHPNGFRSIIYNQQIVFDTHLEKKFRQNQLDKNVDLFRILAVLGMFMYGSFYIADYFVIAPDRLIIHQIVRLMIVLPFSIAIIGLSYKKFFYTNFYLAELAIFLSLLFGQAFHILLSLSENIPGYYYLAVTIMLVLWGNSFPTLRFCKKLFFTILNLVTLLMFLIYFAQKDMGVIAFQALFYIGLTSVSIVAAYLNETGSRNNFIKEQRLTENARGFNKVAQMTAHELKTSMRVINGLSYIIAKDDKEQLSSKSLENLDLIQEHILNLNKNLEELKDHAVASLG